MRAPRISWRGDMITFTVACYRPVGFADSDQGVYDGSAAYDLTPAEVSDLRARLASGSPAVLEPRTNYTTFELGEAL